MNEQLWNVVWINFWFKLNLSQSHLHKISSDGFIQIGQMILCQRIAQLCSSMGFSATILILLLGHSHVINRLTISKGLSKVWYKPWQNWRIRDSPAKKRADAHPTLKLQLKTKNYLQKFRSTLQKKRKFSQSKCLHHPAHSYSNDFLLAYQMTQNEWGIKETLSYMGCHT